MSTHNSNSNTHPTHNTSGKQNAVTASHDQAEQFRAAYESTAAERDALGEDSVLRINVDIPTAVNTVLAKLPKIEALAGEAQGLPAFDMASINKLGTYAKALSYAEMLYDAASSPVEDVPALVADLAAERAKLLASADALAARGLIDGSRLGDLKGGPGYKNIAYDAGTLVAMLRAAWPRIEGKTAVTQDELTHTQVQTETLLMALAAREQQQIDTAAAGEQRSRAFTLLANAYDQVRRAITFLRWNEPVDDVAPSLYAHAAPHKQPPAPEPAPAPAASAAPSPAGSNGAAQVAPGMPGGSPYAAPNA